MVVESNNKIRCPKCGNNMEILWEEEITKLLVNCNYSKTLICSKCNEMALYKFDSIKYLNINITVEE